jgi:hypothetical protein
MKKGLLVGVAAGMAMLLSSCFTLQSFSLQDSSLKRKQATKAVFVVRPSSTTKNVYSKLNQFVLIGVSIAGDVSIGKATWNAGKNAKFGAPKTMAVSPALAGSIGTDCDSSGLTYSTITGMTWKGFITQTTVNDKQLVDQTVSISVALKATASAAHSDQVTVIGITGAWQDSSGGDGLLNAPDNFYCTGNATTSLFIK